MLRKGTRGQLKRRLQDLQHLRFSPRLCSSLCIIDLRLFHTSAVHMYTYDLYMYVYTHIYIYNLYIYIYIMHVKILGSEGGEAEDIGFGTAGLACSRFLRKDRLCF